MTIKIITIGVYGFSEEAFFNALQKAQVDTFCDIRARRGVRGSAYAFANSQRLQKRLQELGVRYFHCQDLAPSQTVRQRQYDEDRSNKTAKRKRTELGQAFRTAYQEEILDSFDPQSFLDDLPSDARVVALFCVEKEPAACHRSLVAGKFADDLGLQVDHILPPTENI